MVKRRTTHHAAAILLVAVSVPVFWSCTGSETNGTVQEPTAAESNTPPAIPDMPGDAGEAAEKPAGEAGTAAKTSAADAVKPAATLGDMYVTSAKLNVHNEKKTKSPTVRTLKKGDKVAITECDKFWCQIGEKEFVSKKFLSPNAPKPKSK